MISIKISFGILLIVAFIFYVLYVDTVSLFLLLFLIILPILSGIMFHISKKKLKFSLCSDTQSISKGNSVSLNLIIENKSNIPFGLCKIRVRYENSLSDKTEYFNVKTFIPQNNTIKVSVALNSSYCGCVKAEIVKINIYDILLMFSHKIKEKKLDDLAAKTQVTVLPNLSEIVYENGFSDIENYESDVMSKTKKGDDPSEVFDTHKYVLGDRLNRVHWKLSARLDEIFVKDFSMPISNSCYLIFDTALGEEKSPNKNLSKIDTCLEGLLSFSYNFVQNEISHNIVFFNKEIDNYDLCSVTTTDDCYFALKMALKGCSFDKKIVDFFIENELENKKGQVFYFTPHIDEKTMSLLDVYSDNLKITVITLGEKAEILQSDNSDITLIKVVSEHFSESISRLYD